MNQNGVGSGQSSDRGELDGFLQQRNLPRVVDVVLDDAMEEDVVRHARAERTAARIVGWFVESGLRQYLHGLD